MVQNLNLTGELEIKIRKYLEFVWKQEERDNPVQEALIMNKLTRNLRDKIYLQSNVRYLKNVPFLAKILSENTLVDLSRIMKKVRFSPEELVYKVRKFLR